MDNIEKLENRLWESADQLRANSKLTSNQYCMPVLGLIFLRHAQNRFLRVKAEVETTLPRRGGVPRALTKDDFLKKGSLFLQTESQYGTLVQLPADRDIGKAIIDAMERIESDYESLRGVLPKDYHIFESDVLGRLIKIFNDEVLQKASGDVFGRIYEYFLMKFAMEGAQDNGEFFTPVSLVQLIVNIIEPDHGFVFDPACGSGGMFVQTSHFLESAGKTAHGTVTFRGQEKTETTIKLAKMNLAVHGLEGQIAEGNTFYTDRHELLGKCDFVMANPPFNVDEVDASKIENDPRLPFGLPGRNAKGAVPNGNYLWISYFYSYLKETGRAGFVMSSQASSAGHGEKELRRKLVESGAVDAMIAIRPNFFYTRTVPCELWFLDRDKPDARKDTVLMLDARSIFRKVTRKVYDFSPEQMKNLTAIVWLYRGETVRFLGLIREYFDTLRAESLDILRSLGPFDIALKTFGDMHSKVDPDALRELGEAISGYEKDRGDLARMIEAWRRRFEKNPAVNKDQLAAREAYDPIAERIRGLTKQVELLHKLASRLSAQETDSKLGSFNGTDRKAIVRAINQLDETRHDALEHLKYVVYFYRQIHWLQERFPKAELADVPGLVKVVNLNEIKDADWSLTPGRYVGVALQEDDEDFDFEQTMRDIHVELADLNKEASSLAKQIQESFEDLGI
jgi:type I restriction enzyme M protein